jgi:hypothetical protein
MTDLTTTISAIHTMTSQEIDRVIEAIKRRRTMLAKSAARTIRRGDSVSFAGRGGETIRGTVLKVNPKTVIVSSSLDATRWRVTASMLSVD